MPAPLRVDWDIPKQMFLGGLSLLDIAARCNIGYPALRQRARRYKWKTESETFSQQIARSVADTVTAVAKRDTRDILKQGNAWRSRIVRLTERHLQAIEQKNPEALMLEDFDVLSRITDRTDQIARRSFGLDAQGQTAQVLVHVQSGLGQLPGRSADAIDVESVPTKVADAQQ